MKIEKNKINIPIKKLENKLITIGDLDDDLRRLVSKINQEFIDGLSFIRNHPKSVTFFGSSRVGKDNQSYKKAESLAKKLSGLGFDVITGGGPGIMEAANKGAFGDETIGKSIGLGIELPKEQRTNPFVEKGMNFHYFFSRKVVLTFSAEAYIFFPGGYGTMDEFFEILTLVQTKKIQTVPIILVGSGYWKEIDSLINNLFIKKYKTISKTETNLYKITDNEDEIVEIVKNAPMRDE